MKGQHEDNDFAVCWLRDRDILDLKTFFVGFEDCGFACGHGFNVDIQFAETGVARLVL